MTNITHAPVRDPGVGLADARCRDLLAVMQTAHPRLGLTFGYVGNCDLTGSRFDDRSWSFFAKLATPHARIGCDVRFGAHQTAKLHSLADLAEAKLADWCAEQERRLDAGEIRVVGAQN